MPVEATLTTFSTEKILARLTSKEQTQYATSELQQHVEIINQGVAALLAYLEDFTEVLKKTRQGTVLATVKSKGLKSAFLSARKKFNLRSAMQGYQNLLNNAQRETFVHQKINLIQAAMLLAFLEEQITLCLELHCLEDSSMAKSFIHYLASAFGKLQEVRQRLANAMGKFLEASQKTQEFHLEESEFWLFDEYIRKHARFGKEKDLQALAWYQPACTDWEVPTKVIQNANGPCLVPVGFEHLLGVHTWLPAWMAPGTHFRENFLREITPALVHINHALSFTDKIIQKQQREWRDFSHYQQSGLCRHLQKSMDLIEAGIVRVKPIQGWRRLFATEANKTYVQWVNTLEVPKQKILDEKVKIAQRFLARLPAYHPNNQAWPSKQELQQLKKWLNALEEKIASLSTNAKQKKDLSAKVQRIKEDFSLKTDVGYQLLRNICANADKRLALVTQQKNGIELRLPREDILKKWISEAAPYMDGVKFQILQSVQAILLGEKYPENISVLYGLLRRLLSEREELADTKEFKKFISPIFTRYLYHAVYSSTKPPFALLHSFDENLSAKWLSKRQHEAEHVATYLQSLLRGFVPLDGGPAQVNREIWPATVEHATAAIQRAKAFGKNIHLIKMLNAEFEKFIDKNKENLHEQLGYHRLISAWDNPQLIVRYGNMLLQSLIHHEIWDDLENLRVFLRRHQSLLQQSVDAQLLKKVEAMQTWDPRLQYILDQFASVHVQEIYRLRWFTLVLNDRTFAEKYWEANPYHLRHQSLEEFFGESGLEVVRRQIVTFLATNAPPNEYALMLINHYLETDSAFQASEQGAALKKQFARHIANIQYHQEIEREATLIGTGLQGDEAEQAQAKSALRHIFGLLQMYANEEKDWHKNQRILISVINKLGAHLAALQPQERENSMDEEVEISTGRIRRI